MLLKSELPTLEVAANFVLWTGAVIYSNYKFYNASKDYDDPYDDFSNGWALIGRRKDVSDPEWEFIMRSLRLIIPWLFIHVFLIEIVKFYHPKLIPYLQFGISMLFLLIHSNPFIIFLLLLQPALFELSGKFKRISVMWFCCIVNLILVTFCKSLESKDFPFYEVNDYQQMLLIAAFYWANLRCISYYADKINKGSSTSYPELLAFIFYLPVLLSGPFVNFEDYKGTFCVQRNFRFRLSRLVKNLFRILFWVVFTEAALHFIYVNAMVFQLEYVKSFDAWTMYGYGYAMGQFFHLKYVIFYGLANVFAEFEGAHMPLQPKCIGRIHIYSDMWKHFDQGLHKFLLRYIYIPILKNKSIKSKFFGAMVSFVFVYVWHGLEVYILLWTILNFIGIIVENSCSQYFKKCQNDYKISNAWKRRTSAIFAAPLLAILTINSYSFISGLNIGIIFCTKFFSDLKESLIVVMFLYCCSQVSIQVKQWESRREMQPRRHKLE